MNVAWLVSTLARVACVHSRVHSAQEVLFFN
jgi:hypothetical protein